MASNANPLVSPPPEGGGDGRGGGDLSVETWQVMLYHYEMWCYDIGCIAIDRHHKLLWEYWDGL